MNKYAGWSEKAMKDVEANVGLIRRINGQLEQFLYEYSPEDLGSIDAMQRAFFRFVHAKEKKSQQTEGAA